MTENKFMNCVLTESILLLCLGLGMLILPKVSMLSFGLIMCLSFVIYGLFKIVYAVITKNFSRHYILDIIIGLIIAIDGIFLLVGPVFDIMLIIGLAGVYFVLKSISSSAYSIQTRKTLNFWWMCLLISILELFFGILIIIILPSAALWFVGIITGMDFVLSGMVYMNMYLATKYVQG